MTDDALRATDALLDAALEVAPAERAAFLDAHAPPALRDYLGDLLAAAEEDDPLLDESPVSVLEVRDAASRAETAAGEVVGPYRIGELLGEGGMGRVYRAERHDGAFDRTVALKLVRQSLTLAGSDVADRLRRERAVLASLEHPHIARLYDGGETPDGVPWVAMELVEGEPITDYAETHGLEVDQRVALAVDVCRAVEHAHRRLVVHRDLKPSNVFVTTDGEGQPVVKLLDFGIARLLDVDAEGLTRTGMPILTPEYAAPEQLEGGEVTTATDVWSLGVLIYELLAGRRPFVLEGVNETGPAARLLALSRALREPSPAPSAVAPSDRVRRLRGDFDAVVLQALRREPERRYASAGGLGDDLARALEGVPVIARAPSKRYLASAFVRRNQGAVAAVAAVVVALVVGLAASLVSLDRERQARADAEAEVVRANATLDFAVDLFGGSDGATLSMESTAGDLLAAGERRAAALDVGGPERAVAYTALREVYGRLHRDGNVLQAADEALLAARAAYGPGHPYTLDAMVHYARHLVQSREFDRAHDLVQTAADGYRALGPAGQRPLGRLLAQFGNMLVVTVYGPPSAEEWGDVARQMLDDAEPLVLATQDTVALVSLLSGRASLVHEHDGVLAAAPLYDELYRIERAVAGDTFDGVITMLNYGTTLGEMGRIDRSVAVLDSAIALARTVVGPDHPAFTLLLANASSARLDRSAPGDIEQALAWTGEIDRPGDGEYRWAYWATTNRLLALRAAGRWRALDERAALAISTFGATGDAATVAHAGVLRAFSRLVLGDHQGAQALASRVLRDGEAWTEPLAHLVIACVAADRGDAVLSRVSLDAARQSLVDHEFPSSSPTSRLVRAGPAGGGCNGWVPRG